MTFGDKIRARRESLNSDGEFSLRKVAKRCGFSATYLSKIERNINLCPTTKVISAIAKDLMLDEFELHEQAGRLPAHEIRLLASKQTLLPTFLANFNYFTDYDLIKIDVYATKLLMTRD